MANHEQEQNTASLLEHGRRDKQGGANARRPGAAAEGRRTAGTASSGPAGAAADVRPTSTSAPPFREAGHQAEQHQEERAKWQETPHLLLPSLPGPG